jgi:hypothetical protein
MGVTLSSKNVFRQDNIAKAEMGLARAYAKTGDSAKVIEFASRAREKFIRMGMQYEQKFVEELLTFGASSKAERSDRKMDTAMFIYLNTMPLNQNIEQSHRVSQAALKISPDSMAYLLEMTDQGQHGQNRFDNHAVVPFPATTKAQVVRLPILFGKTGVGKDGHGWCMAIDQLLKRGAVIHIGGVHIPIHNQSQVIEEETEFPTDNPTLIGQPFTSYLCLCTPFPAGVNQFNTIRVSHADQRMVGQKASRPLLMR